jgi:hypothetical protein
VHGPAIGRSPVKAGPNASSARAPREATVWSSLSHLEAQAVANMVEGPVAHLRVMLVDDHEIVRMTWHYGHARSDR